MGSKRTVIGGLVPGKEDRGASPTAWGSCLCQVCALQGGLGTDQWGTRSQTDEKVP